MSTRRAFLSILAKKSRVSTMIVVLLMLSCLIFVRSVYADIPQILNVVPYQDGPDTKLNVTVYHFEETPSDYVDLLKVVVTTGTPNVSQTFPQSGPHTLDYVTHTFNVTLDIGPITDSPSVTVQAHCIAHGWSTQNWTGIINGADTYASLLQAYQDLTAKFDALNSSYVELSSNFNALAQNYTMLKVDLDSQESAYNSLNQSYLTLNSTVTQLNTEYSTLESGLVMLNLNYDGISAQYDALNQSYANLQTQFNALNQSYGTLSLAYNESKLAMQGELDFTRNLVYILVGAILILMGAIIYLAVRKEEKVRHCQRSDLPL